MNDVKIDSRVLENFVSELLCSSGTDAQEAKIISHVMVWTEMIGRSGTWTKTLATLY